MSPLAASLLRFSKTNPSAPRFPGLLVSVSSASEALMAYQAGVQVIDLKDPTKGSLGCAGPHVIQQVVSALQPHFESRDTSITMALGETVQWPFDQPFSIPESVSGVKLGLAGLAETRNWVGQWTEVRSRFESASERPLNWVAVCYVDHIRASAPDLDQVKQAAIETKCAGLLLDTWDKSSGRLRDYVDATALHRLADELHEMGLFLAAAGRLSSHDLTELAQLPIDLAAVRSAACQNENRLNPLCPDQIRSCLQNLGHPVV